MKCVCSSFDGEKLQYGDPLLDQLDIHKVVHHRLFRESCYNHQGNYVKVSLAFLFLSSYHPLRPFNMLLFECILS